MAENGKKGRKVSAAEVVKMMKQKKMESWVGVVALVEAQEVNNLELLLAEQRLSEKVVDGEHGEAVKKKKKK